MNHSSGGFTLIEFLIYMGIFSMLLVVLTQMFVMILTTQLGTESSSSVEQDSRFILARLMYDVQRASQITVPATLGVSGNTLQLIIGGVSYTYVLNGTNLELNSNQVNSFDTTVSNLSFERRGNVGGETDVNVAFTLKSKVLRNNMPMELKNVQTVIGLRPN